MGTSISASGVTSSPQEPFSFERGGHAVQLYADDRFLLDLLSRFVGAALAVGDAAVVLATEPHLEGLDQRLKARRLDPSKAMIEGRFVPLVAREMLSRILVDGEIDEKRFEQLIGEILERTRNASGGQNARVAVFGELVALLWADGKHQAALRAEQCWNELGKKHSFSLLCAYPISGFNGEKHIEPFLKICKEHSEVSPSESYLAMNSIEDRLRNIAYLEQKTQALTTELQLRQSEERFRLLVEAVEDYAIFMMDPGGHIQSWNTGAQRIKGYNSSEIIGKHFSIFYPAEDQASSKPAKELEIASAVGRFEEEGWRIRKDGSRFWANVIITAMRNESGTLIGFGKVTRDFTERMQTEKALQQEVADRREAERKLQESEKSLRQLSLHLLRTQDEERRRIGNDLHDSLGQSLAAIKMNLDCLAPLVDPEPRKLGQYVSECIRLAENAIKEVRTISYLLYPPMLEEMGLKTAIPWYLEGFSSRSSIRTTFEVQTQVGRLSRDAEVALFRVLQESLTNVVRHSESPTAHIRLFANPDAVMLEIRDRGKGIKLDVLGRSGEEWTGGLGVGLRGMNERMRQLGGRLEVASSGQGTTVTAVVPLTDQVAVEKKSA